MKTAAKVALGSIFFGCGAAAVGAKSAEVEALPAPQGPAPIDPPAKRESLACTGSTALDASVDPPTFECCVGVVEQLTGDAGFATVDPHLVAADPSVDNCCRAIIAFVDKGRGYSEAIPTLGTCCYANDSPRGAACTPWGPPPPPDFFALEVT